MTSLLRLAAGRRGWALLALAAALVALASAGLRVFLPRNAVAVLMPTYEIEAVGEKADGTKHTASLGGLEMGQPGVPQVPIPVDVDGDLVNDILVSVNLVNAEGAFNNPPKLGELLAPNIQVTRDPAAVALGKRSPPLNVQVKFTIKDADPSNLFQSLKSDTVLRFGYDTGPGGSIPQDFKALVAGADQFFNPVTARIDTDGYEGPLQVVGSLGDARGLTNLNGPITNLVKHAVDGDGDVAAAMRFAFRPFPEGVELSFGGDDSGQHLRYAHESTEEVDVDTNVVLRDKVKHQLTVSNVSALIERMPRRIQLDAETAGDRGGVVYDSSAGHPGGRLPDVHVGVSSAKKDLDRGTVGPVLVAGADVEGLPAQMVARWEVPRSGPVHALFETCKRVDPATPCDGAGIGAIEARVADFEGEPTTMTPFVPSEQQFLNVQVGRGAGGLEEHLVTGRVERIRSVELHEDAGAFDSTIKIGDGERPLLAHVGLDERKAGGGLIDATTTVAPLPDTVKVAFRPGEEGSSTEPLTFRYEASESVDIDAEARVLDPAAAAKDAACGAPGTICAALAARHVPTEIEARVVNFKNAEGSDETRFDVDAIPREGGAKPDIIADATIGQDDGVPIVAHAEALGIARFLRVRAVEGEDETAERAEFHTCQRDYTNDTCSDGEADAIEALNFSIRNFLQRPANLPPPYAATPLFANITARGENADLVRFEATGRVVDVSELQYVNKGVFGLRTRIGGGREMSATVDIQDVDLKDDSPDNGLIDVLGEAFVEPLPATLELCFNQGAQPLADAPAVSFTARCQDRKPFGDTVSIARTPTSFGWRASSPFNTSAKVALTLGRNGASENDDLHIRGSVAVDNLPNELTTHVLTPADTPRGGPLRARHVTREPLDVDGDGAPNQVDVTFSGQVSTGDSVCEDPRVTAEALCAGGKLENLPTEVDVFFDPNQSQDNLKVVTSATEKMNFRDLAFSTVKPSTDRPGKSDAIIATGNVLGLPRSIVGTVDLPTGNDDAPSVDVTANPPLDHVDVQVRNYVAPDPLPDTVPTRAGVPSATQLFAVYQRDDLFKAFADVNDFKGGGFTTLRAANGKPTDTRTMRVQFGHDQVIRGYADLELFAERNADGTPKLDSLTQIIGDVTLGDVPAGIRMCLRGPSTVEPATPTSCDAAPDHQGAFQFLQEPATDFRELDIHAFVRAAMAGGTQLLAGRVDILNIPMCIKGSFGGGTVEAAGYEADCATKDGIDKISFELADADLQNHGYGVNPPWGEERDSTLTDFGPAPAPQFMRVAANDSNFHVQGSIGVIEASGGNGSNLQRVLVGDDPCPKPPPIPEVGYTSPPDYPFLPTDPATSHTCIRADFEQVGAAHSTDPLALEAVIDKAGERISLTEAGISDFPAFLQLNLAETDTLDPTTKALRRRCDRINASGQPRDGNTNCMAPLARLDTPGNSTLFGAVRMGRLADLAILDGVARRATAANPDASPVPSELSGGADAWAADWGSDPRGVRVKLGDFTDDPATTTVDEGRMAVKAGVRLDIPRSLTVDQLQSWSNSSATSQNFFEASDLRFHYAIRDGNGDIVPTIGEVSALIHSFPDHEQILIGRGQGNNDPLADSTFPSVSGNSQASQIPNAVPFFTDTNLARGLPIPGELGLDVYVRNNLKQGRKLMQIDGRLSGPPSGISVRARLYGGLNPDAIGRLDAQIKNIPTTTGSEGPEDPSFRVRAEMLGPGAEPSEAGEEAPVTEDEDCSFLLCMQFEAKVEAALVMFDFNPDDDGQFARLLEAVVRQDSMKNGIQVKGYRDINGGPGEEYTARAGVFVNPLNVFFHAGIPVLGSVDFALVSNLLAGVLIENTSDFSLRQNLLHLDLDTAGPGISHLGVFHNIFFMHGQIFSILGFIPFLGGNPLLLGIDFLPPSPPPLMLSYLPCGVSSFGTFGYLPIPPGIGADVVAWPFHDPRIFTYGTLAFGGFLDLILDAVGPFFCFADTSQSLITGTPGDSNRNPGDSLLLAGHPVPGMANVGPPPTSTPAPVTDLTVNSGETLSLCGTRSFKSVTVRAGGILQASNVADGTNCPAADIGRLSLVVEEGVTVEGTLRATSAAPELEVLGNNVTVPSGGLVQGSTGKLTVTAGQALDVAGIVNAGSGSLARFALLGDDVTIQSGGVVQAGREKVSLLASDTLTVAGQVLANARIPVTNVAGGSNGGAGHGAAGGAGSAGAGGGIFGDTSFNIDSSSTGDGLLLTEGGRRGGGPGTPGSGGGTISLAARTVNVTGSVHANGDPGSVGTSGCGAANVVTLAGSGGGSGGGITIAGINVTLASNAVQARGGKGGNGSGGGGGGAGGIVKVKSPVLSGAPSTTGGGRGDSLCPLNLVAFPHGNPGGTPVPSFRRDGLPASSAGALPDGALWTQGKSSPVSVPFTSAAGTLPGSTDYTLVLCGLHRPPEATLANPAPPEPFGLAMPTTQSSVTSPCGSGGAGPQELTSRTVTGAQLLDSSFALSSLGDVADNGYWGFYTVVLKNDGAASNDCRNRLDNFDFTGLFPFQFVQAGIQYDTNHCLVEPLGATPDAIYGIDNNDPDFTLNPSTSLARSGDNFQLLVSNANDLLNQSAAGPQPGAPMDNKSGIRLAECSNDNVTFVDCGSDQLAGTIAGSAALPWALPSGDGDKTVYLRITDQAGNTRTRNVTVKLDGTAPFSGNVAVSGGILGNNGWYRSSPSFTLQNPVDPGAQASGLPAQPFEFWFDSAPPTPCASPCLIGDDPTELPGPGTHTLRWRAIDNAGNTEPIRTYVVRIDPAAPLSELTTIPRAATGANGWFTVRPWVVVSAADQPGRSGLTLGAAEPGDGTVHGVFVRVTSNGVTAPDTAFTAPIRLPNGTSRVCWWVIDVAGNTDATATSPHCTGDIKVDDQRPASPIGVAGPLGLNDWFTGQPLVSVNSTDVGSGLSNPAADIGKLCAPRPPESDPRPAGTCVSVDGRPFVPYLSGVNGPFLMPEGVHEVRAFAVDAAGNRSPIETSGQMVDLSPPVATARVIPPREARGGWWRTARRFGAGGTEEDRAKVVLRAVDGDQNAGLEVLTYSLDGGATTRTYTGPVELPEGVNHVTFWATDRAGHNSRHQVEVPVDVTPPTVKALWPVADALAPLPSPLDAVVSTLGSVVGTSDHCSTEPVALPVAFSPTASGSGAKLCWQVGDNLSGSLRPDGRGIVDVVVVIHDATGKVVRRLHHGPAEVSPGATTTGHTTWDGRRDELVEDGTGSATADDLLDLVEPGVYYYRVIAVDEAGIAAQSGESKPLLVKLL